MITLTAATRQEVDAISRHIGKRQAVANGGDFVWQGAYHGKRVLIVQTGMGRDRAERAVNSVLASYPVTALISFGFGGALIPELAAGDIVLCATGYCPNGEEPDPGTEPYHADAHLLQRAGEALERSGLNWRRGSGVTIPGLASRAEDKRKLGDRTAAHVCEMEDYWIARAARARKVPFLAVRVIYDEMQTDLPDFERLIDRQGNLRLKSAVPYLLSHPAHLINATILYRNSSRARDSLSAFFARFLEII